MGKERKTEPGRRRRGEIEYYIVLEREPSPEVLLQNYIWCLKQREAGRKPDKESPL